jgi:hypothetical protein
MKLQLLTMVVSLLFFVHGDELFSPSLPNSVCDRKKNQPHRLASSTSYSTSLAPPLSFFPRRLLHTPILPSSSLLKLQVASNPA